MSRSGFYEWRHRAPSARAIRHVWLTDRISAIHEASRQIYGAPRVTAELVHTYGVTVGHNTVSLLMRRAGLAGLPLRRKAKRVPNSTTMTDLVRRYFYRDGPHDLDSSSRCNTYLEVVAMPGPKYTPEQKEMFFVLIDRGGTVRAAAGPTSLRAVDPQDRY